MLMNMLVDSLRCTTNSCTKAIGGKYSIYKVSHNENFTLRKAPYLNNFNCYVGNMAAAMPHKYWITASADARF